MIGIINSGKNPYPTGIHSYRVQINDQVICHFTHLREEGLAECLEQAAKAVRKAQHEWLTNFHLAVDSDGQEVTGDGWWDNGGKDGLEKGAVGGTQGSRPDGKAGSPRSTVP